MKRKVYLFALAVLLAFFWTSGPVLAGEDDTVTLGAGKTVQDDFYAASRVVKAAGNVNGDLMAAGDMVSSAGDISGDVLAAGRTIDLGGRVNGNVRAAGDSIAIRSSVERAVTVLGRRLSIGPEADVGRNLIFAGEQLDLAGTVEGNVRAWVNTAVVSGRVDGNLEIEAEQVVLQSGAQVSGDLVVRGANPPQVDELANVKGEVKYTPVTPEKTAAPPWWQVIGDQLLALVKVLGLALLLALLAAPFLRAEVEVLRDKLWTGLGAGLGWLVLTPPALILLAVLVVGQSVAWVLGVAYAGLFFLAILLFKPVLGVFLGLVVLNRFGGRKEISLVWATLLGTALIWLAGLIPVAGFFVTVLGATITLGSWLVLLARYGLSRPGRAGN